MKTIRYRRNGNNEFIIIKPFFCVGKRNGYYAVEMRSLRYFKSFMLLYKSNKKPTHHQLQKCIHKLYVLAPIYWLVIAPVWCICFTVTFMIFLVLFLTGIALAAIGSGLVKVSKSLRFFKT